MWRDLVRTPGSDFSSTLATGKWIMQAGSDPDARWADIRAAVNSGRLVSAKRTDDNLDRRTTTPLILVYVTDVGTATLAQTLSVLRSMGVEGNLRFKTDAATTLGRDVYLLSSDDIEENRFLEQTSDIFREYPLGMVMDNGGSVCLVVSDHLRQADGDIASFATMLDRQTWMRLGAPAHMQVALARTYGMGTWRFSEAAMQALNTQVVGPLPR